MKKTHKKNFLMMLLLSLMLISCGSDDDDGDDSPERQEDTTPTTTCLSSTQRSNIQTFLNRLSDLRNFPGRGVERAKQTDGTTTVTTQIGGFNFSQASENSWIQTFGFCNEALPGECNDGEATLALKNGCFFENNSRARSINTSTSSLSFRFTDPDDGDIVREQWSISSGVLKYTETIQRRGITIFSFNFTQE